jgi:hypothetical protein
MSGIGIQMIALHGQPDKQYSNDIYPHEHEPVDP